MIEKLPPDVLDSENWKIMLTRAEDFLKEKSEFETPSNVKSQQQHELNTPNSYSSSSKLQEHGIEENNETVGVDPSSQDEGNVQVSNSSSLSNNEASMPSQNDSKSQDSSRPGKEGETEVIEFEPGVHVTLIVKPGGVRFFKQVKFRCYSYLLIQQTLHFQFLCVNMHYDYV